MSDDVVVPIFERRKRRFSRSATQALIYEKCRLLAEELRERKKR